jgi:hypothetical protein
VLQLLFNGEPTTLQPGDSIWFPTEIPQESEPLFSITRGKDNTPLDLDHRRLPTTLDLRPDPRTYSRLVELIAVLTGLKANQHGYYMFTFAAQE